MDSRLSSFALVEELEEHLRTITKIISLQAQISKNQLIIIGAPTLISLAALALGRRRKNGREREEEDGMERKKEVENKEMGKMNILSSLSLYIFFPKLIK